MLEAQNERLIQELKKVRTNTAFLDFESQQLASGEVPMPDRYESSDDSDSKAKGDHHK